MYADTDDGSLVEALMKEMEEMEEARLIAQEDAEIGV